MKTIYVITHADKLFGANPNLSEKGIVQTEHIKKHLPQDIDYVICGVGKRHLKTAQIIGMELDRYTSICGESDSLELVEGKKAIILADGTVVPFSAHTTVDDLQIATEIFINNCPANSLLIAGRPFMINLEKMIPNNAESASLYKIEIDQKGSNHRCTLIYRP